MSKCHGFEFTASPALRALATLVSERFALSAEQAAVRQPEFERQLRAATMRVEREVHAADLARLDVKVDGLVVDGKRYRRRAEKTVGTYDTSAGPVKVARSVYRRRGGHGGATLCPLEMRVGMVAGRWTPAAAETACGFVASAPPKEAARLLSSTGTMKHSPAHLDRLPKAVGAVWEADRERFEAAVREAEASRLPPMDLVVLILVSLDGVMVPMKDAPRTPGAGKQDTGPKGHKEASCGTLALFDAAGNRLHTIYLARMPESKKVTLKAQLLAELGALLQRYPNAALQAVADGADENWRIIGEIGDDLEQYIDKVLDYFHAVEHVDEALRRHAGRNRKQAKDAIARWNRTLRDEPNGVRRVAQALQYRVGRAKSKGKRDDILKQYHYVDRHRHMMHYAELQAAGRPIGSGIQEAACKTLVSQRMKRSGMSWRNAGGQAVLLLRSAQHSGRAEDAWNVLRPAFRKDFEVDSDTERLKPRREVA